MQRDFREEPKQRAQERRAFRKSETCQMRPPRPRQTQTNQRRRIFEAPLTKAKQEKTVDPAIETTDIVLMLRMIGGAVRSGATNERRQVAMRAVELLSRGICF